MQCTEAHPPTLADWHELSLQTYYKDAQREMFSLPTTSLKLADIWKDISAYSRRKLSFRRRLAQRFLGYTSLPAGAGPDTMAILGIPIQIKGDKYKLLKTWQPPHYLLTTLNWSHSTNCRRRPGFPSWS
jgi:hypothetical protein